MRPMDRVRAPQKGNITSHLQYVKGKEYKMDHRKVTVGARSFSVLAAVAAITSGTKSAPAARKVTTGGAYDDALAVVMARANACNPGQGGGGCAQPPNNVMYAGQTSPATPAVINAATTATIQIAPPQDFWGARMSIQAPAADLAFLQVTSVKVANQEHINGGSVGASDFASGNQYLGALPLKCKANGATPIIIQISNPTANPTSSPVSVSYQGVSPSTC